VAVWGCGPVGLFAIASAYLLGAERVIAIDRFPERLRKAREDCRAETLNYEEVDIQEALRELTGGRGPDSCIDAVGMEAHGHGIAGAYDRIKQAFKMQTDRPTALRQAILACRTGGTLSVPGVYGGLLDKVPFGSIVNKALTVKTGQTHVQRYLKPLLDLIDQGKVDPSFVITHCMSLEDAPEAYKQFRDKQDECIKIVLKPSMGKGEIAKARPTVH
jgi:threonine dehydrogenase-like Zn-dependent dehydrogenase